MVDTSKLMLTNRLLAEEAMRRGYGLSMMASRPSAKSYTIRCEKDGKELYFKSLHTALSPSYAVFMAGDKLLTRSMLNYHNVPTPDTAAVYLDDLNNYKMPDDVKALLHQYGRLVVKPATTNHGRGITIDVRSEKDLRKAIEISYCEEYEPDIIVQQMVFGREYRFLILQDKVLAVAYRRPPFVIGDGVSTIRELIDRKNLDPRRGEGHSSVLTKIDLDQVINDNPEGFLDVVPNIGTEVDVLKTSNLSRGGESADVTDEASSELKVMAVRAARACSLGIAGVDIVTQDISGNGRDSYVLEVNASPGIRMHQFPSVGVSRNVAKDLFTAIEKTACPIAE